MRFSSGQLKTINSLKKINDNIYTIHYQNNYGRKEIVGKSLGNAATFYRAIQKYFGTNQPLINPFSPKGGCIGVTAFKDNGEVLFARNFDYKKTNGLIVWIDNQEGYKSINMADFNLMGYGRKHFKIENSNKARLLAAPYVCMDGMNEKGLAVSIIEVKYNPSKQERGKTRILPTSFLRVALDTCSNVEEVIKLTDQYDMCGTLGNDYHYHVSDINGNSVILEYIDNKLQIIRNNESSYYPNRYMWVPSFFVSKDGNNVNITTYAKERNDIVSEDMTKKDGIYSEKELHSLLERCKTNHHHEWMPHMVVTVWSIIYNLNNLSAIVCGNNNFDEKYKIELLKPLQIEKVVE